MKLLIRALIVVAILVGAAVAYVFIASEMMLRRDYSGVALAAFDASSAPVDTLEGKRKAVLVGCLQGCHGPAGEGGDEGAPGVFRATAPPFSQVLPAYSDPELVRLIRFGVKRDGRTAIGMPSGTFFPLSNQDLAGIITHLRSRPSFAEVPRTREVQLLGRLALVLGEWHTSAGEVDPERPRWGELPRQTSVERGRYLASAVCAECHGRDFRGVDYMNSPALSVVTGYEIEPFRTLLRTGRPISGRDLGIMSRVARAAFVEFTDQEVADLHDFCRSLADSAETPAR